MQAGNSFNVNMKWRHLLASTALAVGAVLGAQGQTTSAPKTANKAPPKQHKTQTIKTPMDSLAFYANKLATDITDIIVRDALPKDSVIVVFGEEHYQYPQDLLTAYFTTAFQHKVGEVTLCAEEDFIGEVCVNGNLLADARYYPINDTTRSFAYRLKNFTDRGNDFYSTKLLAMYACVNNIQFANVDLLSEKSGAYTVEDGYQMILKGELPQGFCDWLAKQNSPLLTMINTSYKSYMKNCSMSGKIDCTSGKGMDIRNAGIVYNMLRKKGYRPVVMQLGDAHVIDYAQGYATTVPKILSGLGYRVIIVSYAGKGLSYSDPTILKGMHKAAMASASNIIASYVVRLPSKTDRSPNWRQLDVAESLQTTIIKNNKLLAPEDQLGVPLPPPPALAVVMPAKTETATKTTASPQTKPETKPTKNVVAAAPVVKSTAKDSTASMTKSAIYTSAVTTADGKSLTTITVTQKPPAKIPITLPKANPQVTTLNVTATDLTTPPVVKPAVVDSTIVPATQQQTGITIGKPKIASYYPR